MSTTLPGLLDADLPKGVRSRFVDGGNGLRMHVLEAGFEARGRPLVLLLHGFPELAYSWRKVMPALAAAGLHVVAPDQRGYGRTTGWDGDYDGDLASFRLFNLVQDALELISALGHPPRRRRHRPRLRLARRGPLRTAPAGRLHLGGHDERTVRWRARARARSSADLRHPRRPGAPDAAAKAVSMVLFDPVGRCRHARPTARDSRFPARLLSLQERRLAREPTASLNAWIASELAKLPEYLCDAA